ncbi:unnamed protein product, partial [Adineta ricciae]
MLSETAKEMLAGLCGIIRILSDKIKLPTTFVYDDYCHVVKHIIDYYPSTLRATPASSFLYNLSLSIEAYHYCNRVDKWYKEHLNPDKNDIVKRRFDDAHCSLFPSLILHVRNYLRTDPYAFFPIHQHQLQQRSIEDNEGQYVDLPNGSQTAPTAFVTSTNDLNDTNSSSLTTTSTIKLVRRIYAEQAINSFDHYLSILQ